MAITVDGISAALAVAQKLRIKKQSGAAKSVGAYQSLWTAAGMPGAGSTPPAYTAGSGYTCDDATAGAPVPGLVNTAGGGLALRVGRAKLSCAVAGTLHLYDRLWSCSGMGFAAGTYTVTTPGSLPARITDNGVGVEAFVENFVAAGAASGTLTLNYANANAGAAKSGVIAAVVSAPVAGQVQPIPLAVGDSGVRSVTSAVTSATWTSGSFGITLAKPICEIEISTAGGGRVIDYAGTAIPAVLDDACLWAIWQPAATTATWVDSTWHVIDIG